MSAIPTESDRRLRATVRVLLSHGVWVTLFFELGVALLPHAALAEGLGVGRFALLGLLTAITVYLQAGAMYALARGREVVAVPEVLVAGKDVFPRFIVLSLKAALLYVVGLIAVLSLLDALGYIEIDGEAALPAIAPIMTALIVPTKYALAYWLPWVFTCRDFRLLPTLQAALRVGWQRLARAGLFLALLLVLPGSVLFGLPQDLPWLLHAGALFTALLLDWIAYVYCLEAVRPAVANAPST
jgi:hypothetical protein